MTTATRVAAQTERIVGRLLETMPRRGGRGNLLRTEISAVVAGCLDLMADERVRPAARMGRIHRAAARWAGVGVPIETVHRMVRQGFRLHLDGHLDDPRTPSPRTEEIGRLLDALHAVTATVSRAYAEVAHGTDRAEQDAVALGLLGGGQAARIGREYGVPVAAHYTVLAVTTAAAGDRTRPSALRELLSRRCGQPVPALISAFGGTILVPGALARDGDIDGHLAEMSLSAAAIGAPSAHIPAAADAAHELLDVVGRVYGTPGLHHFDDFALEYQLTRPGPGRDRLAALLDPLPAHPELLHTLRVHVRNDLNRRLTSRALHIHQNTVDHRLKRIGVLVGLDANRPSGLWQLRAALIARNYTHPEENSVTDPGSQGATPNIAAGQA